MPSFDPTNPKSRNELRDAIISGHLYRPTKDLERCILGLLASLDRLETAYQSLCMERGAIMINPTPIAIVFDDPPEAPISPLPLFPNLAAQRKGHPETSSDGGGE